MDRLFHRKLNFMAKCGIGMCSLLAVYFFWEKLAVVGLFLMIIVVGMIERVIHTTYTFRRLKPIDMDEECDFLIIDNGRFSRNINIPLAEIKNVEFIKRSLSFERSVLIEYGPGNMVSVQPDNEELFLSELNKRRG